MLAGKLQQVDFSSVFHFDFVFVLYLTMPQSRNGLIQGSPISKIISLPKPSLLKS